MEKISPELKESSSQSEIVIHKSPCGAFFVWVSDMAFSLRQKHRIYGRFVGTLPRCHSQNSCLGLPLLLSREEVAVARKQDGVRLLTNTSVADKPAAPDTVAEHQRLLALNHKEMAALEVRQKRLRMVGHYHEIRAGLAKRRERLLRRRARGEAVEEAELRLCEEAEGSEGGRPFSVDDVRLDPLSEERVWRHLPTATPRGWKRAGEEEEEEESAKVRKRGEEEEEKEDVKARGRGEEEEEEEEEENPFQRLRTRLFEELWRRGHHVTVSTAKMGGDFLLYPGDPARYHASHIVVLAKDEVELPAHDLCALLRLGNSLKKVVVLASESADRTKLVFTTMTWAGVG